MSFSLYIARRYLFSKKRHNAINIISAISMGGVALATVAMVCTLSVFNGFRDLIGSLYTAIDPELEITATQGKFIDTGDARLQQVKQHEDVEQVSQCLTDHALILFKGRPVVVTLHGVDDQYSKTVGIDSILYSNGNSAAGLQLHSADIDYGTPGIGLASQIGAIDFGSIQICAPAAGERISLTNPIESFNVADISASGHCFQVHQRKYDESTMIVPLHFAQDIFDKQGYITSLAVKLHKNTNLDGIKNELRQTLGPEFQVKDRLEQQQDTFNIMEIEKFMAYLFLSFIVLVACFNIISSVSMLIIDKRDDVQTLRHLGASDKDIVRIFLMEGRMIALIGAVVGVIIGVLLCLGQQVFGWLRLGDAEGNFIVNAYPVSVHLLDVFIVFITVIAVGFISVWYPVRYLSRRLI